MIVFNNEQRFIVTGASSGIGESVALLLNELGAGVIAIGRNQERLDAMKAKCKFADNMFLENKELTDNVQELPKYVKSLKDKYGKIQGLAYCAGIVMNIPIKMQELTDAKKIFDVNYFAPIFMAKGLVDKRINVGNGTSMVFVSGCAALNSPKALSIYSGAKAALIASVKSIARENAHYGVRANCVLPTDIKTPMTMADMDILEVNKEKYPMDIGEVVDVANMIVFLLSDKAKWITAQDYIIDCGSF